MGLSPILLPDPPSEVMEFFFCIFPSAVGLYLCLVVTEFSLPLSQRLKVLLLLKGWSEQGSLSSCFPNCSCSPPAGLYHPVDPPRLSTVPPSFSWAPAGVHGKEPGSKYQFSCVWGCQGFYTVALPTLNHYRFCKGSADLLIFLTQL